MGLRTGHSDTARATDQLRSVGDIPSLATSSISLLAKRTAATLKRSNISADERLAICIQLLDNQARDPKLQRFCSLISALPTDHRHYWIGSFYTLLLPQLQRRKQSAYFTRPEIAHHLLQQLEAQGANFRTARVLDPAAGGAAFLSMVAARMRELGCTPRNILTRIKGIEIDPKLAQLSRLLIANRLGIKRVPDGVIAVGDALNTDVRQSFDVVLANPPYGRVPPTGLRNAQWASVCHPNHVNLYALFIDFCLRRTKPGGHLGFVVPSSYIAGPLYCKLRTSIRERSQVKLIGHIECREEYFLDVLQDVSLLALQCLPASAHGSSFATKHVSFARIGIGGQCTPGPTFRLPRVLGDAWVLPSTTDTARGGATLQDFGCRVTSGYFVWNRQTERMRKRPLKRVHCVPLFWACNIRANTRCVPHAKDRKGTDFVKFDEPSDAILRGPSILLQRTTNTKQKRRLIAGLIKPGPLTARGYVSENHTIVVRPTDGTADLDLVCRLLNSEAVDRRYRQISGTASISTLLLRSLDLPHPQALQRAIAKEHDFEKAVELAYTLQIPAIVSRAA